MDHLPPLPIGRKYLVYFLCCLRPHKLWVAWPVEEMRRDRKEIEMGPPGLFWNLETIAFSRLQNWDPRLLGTLQVWPAGTQQAVRYWALVRVIISIGPISYLGSCNFGKQCIVLETLPIDLQLALPHHQLEIYSWHNLTCWVPFYIIFAMSMNRFTNVYACLLFQSSARMPCNFKWLPTRRERSKITGFTSFAHRSFWVVYAVSIGQVYLGNKWKYMQSKYTY